MPMARSNYEMVWNRFSLVQWEAFWRHKFDIQNVQKKVIHRRLPESSNRRYVAIEANRIT